MTAAPRQWSFSDGDLFLDETHRKLADSVDRLVADIAQPAEGKDAASSAVEILAGAGMFDSIVPPAGALQLRRLSVLRERLAPTCWLLDQVFQAHGMVLHAVARADQGTAPEILESFRTGARVATVAGSTGSLIARPHDGGYVLNGDARLVPNAAVADWIVVLASVEPTGAETLFLVETVQQGVRVDAREILCPPSAGDLSIDELQVSEACRVGAQGAGGAILQGTRRAFGVSTGAAALGLAAACLQETEERVGPAGGEVSQGVQHQVADMATEIDGARLLVYRSAAAHDRGDTESPTLDMAASFATEVAARAVAAAMELQGPAALLDGSSLEGWSRQIRTLRLLGESSGDRRDRIAHEILHR